MRRRELIAVAGGAMIWPAVARSQRAGKIHKVGLLAPAINLWSSANQAFREELRKFGFAEGENLVIELRLTEDPRGPSAMAAELARMGVDVFVNFGAEAALKALVPISGTTPVVNIAVNYDPVQRGYAASLARPGGNVTGVFLLHPELAAKQLELLILAFPDQKRIGVLWDAISADQFAMAEKAAKSMRLELLHRKLENPPYDFVAALRTLAAGGAQSVLVLSSYHFVAQRRTIAEEAIRHRLPTIFTIRAYVDAGGLMFYGVSFDTALRQAAVYTAKILNGAKPADLPIEQSSDISLVVNLKTATALGITIPPGLLGRADEVIE